MRGKVLNIFMTVNLRYPFLLDATFLKKYTLPIKIMSLF